jgi:LysR family nitrogen assimilation transcriptional regulator
MRNVSHFPAQRLVPRRGPALEIRHLRYFIAIYEAGSVTKASLRLMVAQSALSQQLAQLEDELGVLLFARSPQGVAPTAFGQLFYDHSREILQRLGDAVESVRQLGQNPKGTVAIGMPETISVVLGLPLLQNTRLRYPEVRLRLTEDLSGNLVDRLSEGRLDLAILFDDGMNAGLAVMPLVEEPLFLISRRADEQSDHISLADALASPLVLPEMRDGLRRNVENAARRAGVCISNLVSEVSSLTVIKNAVLQGLGATILPISAFAGELQQGAVQAREINPAIRVRIVLCTRKDALLDRAAASVFRLTASTAQELCADTSWIGGTVVDGGAGH